MPVNFGVDAIFPTTARESRCQECFAFQIRPQSETSSWEFVEDWGPCQGLWPAGEMEDVPTWSGPGVSFPDWHRGSPALWEPTHWGAFSLLGPQTHPIALPRPLRAAFLGSQPFCPKGRTSSKGWEECWKNIFSKFRKKLKVPPTPPPAVAEPGLGARLGVQALM